MGLVSKLVKSNTDINDQLLFVNAVGAAKAGAKAYLAATLVSTTPELRQFFQTQLTQTIICHTSLVELGLKKGWIDPSMTPIDALKKELEKSDWLFEHDE